MTTQLPDFNGEPVTSTAIKFTGVGTGFSGLEVRPIVMELDDIGYFVVKVKAAESASHIRKDDALIRMQRVHAEDIAPISAELAAKVLQEYAQEIEAAKAKLDGQMQLELEHAAEARERDDENQFQGRSGVHPTGGAHLDAGEGDDDVEAAELAEQLADDQADDDETPSNVLTPSFAPPAAGH